MRGLSIFRRAKDLATRRVSTLETLGVSYKNPQIREDAGKQQTG